MPLELLARAIWALRTGVLACALLLYLAAAATVLSWPRQYVAEAVVAPAETTGIATSSLLSPVPALPGLLDPRPTGNFAVYLGALRSAEAVAMLAEETPLPARLTERRASWLRRLLGLREEADLDDVRNWLERSLGVSQSIVSVTWSLSLAHEDRELALELLQRLHAFAEAKVRADLADLARRRIVVLEARLAQERDLYLRQALFELLAQQQRAALVVEADEAVAARLVSAPVVEKRPSLPNRVLLLALLLPLSVLAALALALPIVFLRAAAPRALPA
jgi:LPS O-antigen subunit length determinant protein (WzzB/FepE family)